MSLIEKINFLLQLKKTIGEIKMLDKLKNGMVKMDGWKSITGLLMVVAYYTAPKWNVHLPDFVLQIGSVWAGIGMAHRLDKATGILSTVLQVLTATKDTVNKENQQEKK